MTDAAEPGIAASLAVVQAAGALSLDLSAGDAGGPTVLMSPMAMSEACTSPWSPVTPAVTSTVVMKPAQSPGVRMSPTLLTSPGGVGARVVRTTKLPAQMVAGAQMSPVSFGPVCTSPGTQIRQNAVSLGIPLSLRAAPGEVCAPVPVRVYGSAPLAPSPTAHGVGAAPVMMPGAQERPPAFLRQIVTPLTGSRPRRAAGGA